MEDNRKALKIKEDKIGEIRVADDVVSIIAGLAATEVEGVATLAGNITNEIVAKTGIKNLSKGVKIDVMDGIVTVELNLTIKYGYSIPEVSGNVQDRVRTAIETMTGLEIGTINIRIANVDMSGNK
ncbi:MAG: Asp23/Gls24 family envelope stress response protein [Eubacterium sp.]|nr:Asp23/Gls24 family envelope stress response protein [Eubacterium sp.]